MTIKRTHDNDNNLILVMIPEECDKEELEKDSVLTILDCLWEETIMDFGDSFCLNNFTMGHAFYDYYMDVMYIFDWSDIDNLKAGKSIFMRAREMDEWDRECFNDFYGFDEDEKRI